MNIFMILCDELRADMLGFMGNEEVKTPSLDRLAEDSVVFTNAYCNSPMCVPSRNSIATGRYAHSHGALDNMLSPLEGEVSFYELLRQDGYKTINHGKWHCNIDPEAFGMDRSRDAGDDMAAPEKYITCFGITDRETRQSTEHQRNLGEVPLIISGKRPGHKDQAMDSIVTDHYLDELNTIGSDEEKVFARLSIMDPHTPYMPSEPFASMYPPDSLTMPTTLFEDLSEKPVFHSYFRKVRGFEALTESDYRKSKAAYQGLVSHVDERVGKVIDQLKAQNLYDDSLILFLSDHGSMMGEHGFVEKWGHMYEQVMRIPMVIKLPKSAYGGIKLEAFVESVDVMPTILDLLKMPIPSTVQGISLLPYIMGQVESHKSSVYGQYYCGSLQNEAALMVRDEEWKLTSYPEGNRLEGYLPNDHHLKNSQLFDRDYPLGELYDMKKDPEETRNLFDHPDHNPIKQVYLRKLEDWIGGLDTLVDTATLPDKNTASIHVIKQGENMVQVQKLLSGGGRWRRLTKK